MKVVLTGIYYPVAILRYFEQAIKRRPDVEVVTMGPYTGNYIPWNGGMKLKEEYAVQPDIPLPLQHMQGLPSRIAESMLRSVRPDFVPDLWLQVDAGFKLMGKVRSGKNFIVGTDPHCLNYDEQRTYADEFFCMQTPYMKSGDRWLPYAFDPVWHLPDPNNTTEPVYDAGYVGAPYDNRKMLIGALQSNGFKVLATGYGPAYAEARDLYAQMKIGLNWSSLKDLTARVFEICALGLTPVVNRVPDLEKVGFIEGMHYEGFDTVEEAVRKCRGLIDDPKHAEAMAMCAQQFIRPHTWDARVAEVLSYV